MVSWQPTQLAFCTCYCFTHLYLAHPACSTGNTLTTSIWGVLFIFWESAQSPFLPRHSWGSRLSSVLFPYVLMELYGSSCHRIWLELQWPLPTSMSTISIWIPLGRILFCPRRTFLTSVIVSPNTFWTQPRDWLRWNHGRSEIIFLGSWLLRKLGGRWGRLWDCSHASGWLLVHEGRPE